MALNWYFEKFNPNGGTAARGLRRSLSGAGLDEAVKFAREAVQNSCDASCGSGQPVEFVVRLRNLKRSERMNLVELLRLNTGDGPAGRDLVNALPDPLPVLYVEDSGTVGLAGVERSDVKTDPRVDKFVGLCRNFGDSAGDAEGGGTFGFGKTVYWNASSSGMVMFYSRFAPSERSGPSYARLIGGALFDSHEYKGHRYTGRAWLGEISSGDGTPYAAPAVDKAADSASVVLGFTKRPDNRRTGTSILIINSHFSTRDHLLALRSGIEINYWPKIVDGQLVTRIFDNDEELPAPAPKTNQDLLPFIDCYTSASAAILGVAPEPAQDKRTELLKRYSIRLGALSLRALSTTVEGESSPSAQSALMNTVALLRRPRMVVEYYAAAQRPSVDYAGVFIADQELNPVLAKSEPPTHNRWDAAADELSQMKANLYVTSTLNCERRLGNS